MTGMDDRRKAFESKWAHDAELRFEIEARRNRLAGQWAAGLKGLTGEAAEDFIAGVIALPALEKDGRVCGVVHLHDLMRAGAA